MSAHQFSAQYESFRKTGIADDPNQRGTVMKKKTPADNEQKLAPRKRRDRGGVEGDYWGSWAPPDDDGDDEDVGATEAAVASLVRRVVARAACAACCALLRAALVLCVGVADHTALLLVDRRSSERD
jgi:hypothetical protein